jgi:predicted RNase H-like nuclease (RuvC/YqgF family)
MAIDPQTPSITAVILGVASALVAGFLTIIGRIFDRHVNRESKVIEDITKFRTELMDRVKQLEGRLDQLTKDNNELSTYKGELTAKVAMYSREIEELKEELKVERASTAQKLQTAYDKIDELEKIINEKEEEISKLRSQLNRLEERDDTR